MFTGGMIRKHLARKIGEALLDLEPPKKKGGSKERQEWLSVVMEFQLWALSQEVEDEYREALRP